MKFQSKAAILLIAILLLPAFLAPVPSASAEAPYEGYNYSFWKKAEPSAIPYLPEFVIDGRGEDYGLLNSPEDVYVRDGKVYILDTGNNRIVILDQNYQFLTEINSFTNNGSTDSFNNPYGIFVTDQNDIYVADTGNRRIVHLNENGQFIREIGAPESDVIREGFEYHPIKVAVDKAQRIYVIGRGIYDGIIEFDADGVFLGYTGANRVTFTPVEYFWRMMATREQRAKMALFIPIEFNNLDLDEDGFIYTTNSEKDSKTPIQRLNPTGTDVIRKEGYHELIGDIQFPFRGALSGGSTFIDINVNDYGMYSALDSKRGRVFTYDEDGNLLYIFGKSGDQVGTFNTPTAVERLDEDILVLDKGYNNLVVFKPTAFGKNVNEAVRQYHLGNDEEAAAYWENVLRLDANYEVAYVGIGKSLLMEGENKEAMAYFKNGNNKKYYSKAFKRYRQEVLREYFGVIMTVIVLIPITYLGFVSYKAIKRRRRANAIVE